MTVNNKTPGKSLIEMDTAVTTYATTEEVKEHESCPALKIIEILSKKWAMFIVRNLIVNGPMRFNEIYKVIPNISPRTLSSRLKLLQEHQIIIREQFNVIPPKVVYTVTQKGLELQQSFKYLDQWSMKWNFT